MRKHTVLMVLALVVSWIIWIQVATSQDQQNLIQANVDIDPDALLLKENDYGNWITAYIWFSVEGYAANNINASSVTLEVMEGHLPASKYDIQGNILMVKFDKASVISLLEPMMEHMSPHIKQDVTLKVTGKLYAGDAFEGSDTIKVFFNPL